ncbi:unnamed protein product [Penicillium salamii]|nr:unnamed protein product [Penicillium salamii]CAG8330221.1 unnamed protein product [Penicillium salamii]
MKGTVSWFCISCYNSDSYRIKIKFIAYESRSYLICFWLHLLPAKRRININTLCASCLEESNLLSSKEQQVFISKRKDQIMFARNVSWAKQEWDFWVTCRECGRINNSLQQNEGLYVHLVGGVSIS